MEREDSTYSNLYDKHLDYRSVLLDTGPRFYIRTRHMMRFFPSNPKHIIDIGCGDGFFLERLTKKGLIVDGIDASAQAVKLCKERLGGASGHIECCLIEEYKPKYLYDLLLCGEVLEHIEDDEHFLEEISRLAAINAVLILTVPLDMSLWSKADENAGHFRRYTKSEIFSKLQKAGFIIEEYVIWGFPITRFLMPYIRKQQTKMMKVPGAKHPERRRKMISRFKIIFKPLKYIFVIDNLFNFTEKGVDIVIRARKRC